MILKSKIWVLFLLLNLVDSQNPTCNFNDLVGLKAFIQELESPIPGWMELNSSCCNWVGITCDPHSGRVIELDLHSKRLTGGVSELISNIDQLKSLNLSHNFLKGLVPVSVFRFRHLEILDLNSNGFSGGFPGSLDLPKLEYLDVSENAFSGYLPGGLCVNSTRVRVVKLAGNLFTGSFPPELRNCGVLEHVCVANNNLSGPIPEFVFRLPQLVNLDLQNNAFDGIERIGNFLSSVARLDISGNRLSGRLPDFFHKFPNLTRFVASTNRFTGPIPKSLANSPSISVINLQNNSFNGPIKFNCSVMTSLTSIDIGTNNFSGYVPDDLSLCRKLRAINFARNKLVGEIPKSFSDLKSLTYVSFSNCSLSNVKSALSVLQNCPNLTVLILTLNFHNEHLPDDGLFRFKALKALAIPYCGLTGVIPSWLRGLTELQLLDLSWNRLTGTIPSYLGDFGSLFYLDLSNNSLTGQIPKSLTRLRSLQLLNVTIEEDSPDFPFFTKPNVSAQVSPLQYKRVMSFPPCIDLKYNLLTGPIWPEFGNLKRLHVLNLRNNLLSGGIPSELSGMRSIETLILSYNNLSGPIPQSLVKLSFLSSFEVAYNRLTGIVPSGGQFGTFGNNSFEGNKNLCVFTCGDKDNDKDKDKDSRVYRSTAVSSKKSNGPVVGMAIGIGLGTLFILALMFVIILRVTHKQEIVPENDDGYGSNKEEPESKLVFFQTKDELTLDDLLKSTNSFDQANIIGCGGFGLVFKATLPDGQKVAIKRLTGDAGQVDREFQAEVETLSRAQHPNLVLLQGYCQHQNDRFLIYSYMENGSLDYWLHEKPDGPIKLNWATRLRILQGAIKGLAYLHQSCDPHIVHRDIKSSNILLDENFEAHLADFGLARLLLPHDTHVTTDLVGTLGYIPPEYGQASVASYKGDVYSFGVVLLELLTGKRPMDMCKPKGCRDLISWVMEMRRERREEEVFDPMVFGKENGVEMLQVLEIACVCLSESPKLRPSSQELLGWLHSGNLHRT